MTWENQSLFPFWKGQQPDSLLLQICSLIEVSFS